MFRHGLLLGAYLLRVGFFGLITSRNTVRALMRLEPIFNAVNLNLITFSNFFDNQQTEGEILTLFVVAVAAAEAATGLALALAIQRNRRSTRIDQLDLLKW
uniref:NAD(P)H-quinone oxidoreductase subunit 4L, chloroplastic n=1 Tax=Saccoloma inaequale TaxID=262953 RepID=A0A5B9RDD0_9MONI|nr:NADH-plastoquinone oxidoreductase subunit 4L [Saccoloma inaequale]QEG57844.1 NADH-plastoquinone oxidoreductase subunit 4L [Saccoloma inaequale]